MSRMAETVDRTWREILEIERRAEKDREQAEKDRKDFNKRMAELSDSMGTLIEDMVAPCGFQLSAFPEARFQLSALSIARCLAVPLSCSLISAFRIFAFCFEGMDGRLPGLAALRMLWRLKRRL
jgi:hypothetical protein